MASFFLLSPASLDFLARVTILRDCSQSKARTREKNSLTREKKTAQSRSLGCADLKGLTSFRQSLEFSFSLKKTRKETLLTGWCRSYRAAGGGTPGNSWWGCVAGSLNPDLISDQRLVIFHICFQTRPLKSIPAFRPGLQAQIMSSIRRLKRKQKILQMHFKFAYFVFRSYSFGTETINTAFIRFRSSSKTIHSRPKKAKCIPPFSDQKGPKTLPFGAAQGLIPIQLI